ncbi:MAG: hypothetical protein KJZ86_21685 [Caldilineaceae bacterium]|nr:hypothetical protein [Caldilineaceae bacterium]HRJ41055.1 hypothetical protein [Caldilineaceae bacterium]
MATIAQVFPRCNSFYDRPEARSLRNDADGIFGQGGGQLLLAPEKVDGAYTETFDGALGMA